MKDKKDDFDRELDELEADGELYDEEFDFTGRVINMERWKVYLGIKQLAEKLFANKSHVTYIHAVDSPFPHEPNCTITIRFKQFVPFSDSDAKDFARALSMADSYVFFCTDNELLLTICVNDILSE